MEAYCLNIENKNKHYVIRLENAHEVGEPAFYLNGKLDTGATATGIALGSFSEVMGIESLWSRIKLVAKKYGVIEKPCIGIGACQSILVKAPGFIVQGELLIPDFYFDLLKLDREVVLIGFDIIDQFTMYKNPHTNIGLDNFDFNGYAAHYWGRRYVPFEEIIKLLN